MKTFKPNNRSYIAIEQLVVKVVYSEYRCYQRDYFILMLLPDFIKLWPYLILKIANICNVIVKKVTYYLTFH